MTRPFFSSLRFRLLLLVSLAIVPPLAAMLYTAVELRRHETDAALARALQLARHASAIHERLTESARGMLFGLAQLSAVLRGDQALCKEILFAYLGEHSGYDNLGVIKPDGEIFCSARPPGDSAKVAGRPSFQRAVETSKFAITDYEVNPVSGKCRVTFAYPVLDKAGRVQQVLFAVMALDWISELVAEALLPDGTTVTVFDEKGTAVAHKPDGKKWVRQSALQDPVFQAARARKGEGTFEGTSLDSIPRLLAYKPLLGPSQAGNLYLSVGIPTVSAFAESNRILTRQLTLLGLAAVLAIVAAWVGSDLLLLRRVKALVNATQRLRGGDLSARTGLPHGDGELSQLASAFDEMATTLQTRHQEVLHHTEKLATLERRFRALIENSSDGIVLLGADGTMLYASPSTTRIAGYAIEELTGCDAFELIHSDEREQVRARFTEVVQRPGGFVPLTFRLRHKNGSWRWIGCVASNLLDEPSVQAIVGNYRDITERKEAEEALRKSHDELELRVHERMAELVRTNIALLEQIAERQEAERALSENRARLAGVIGSAMDAIISTDPDQRIIMFNAAAERIFRCSAAETIGQPIERFIPERFRDKHREGVRAFARADATDREKGRQLSMIGLRADGEEFAVEATISQSEAAGQPIYTIILRDVTARQRGEETLRKLSRVVEQTGDSVVVTDRDGTIEYVNPSFEELTGFSREEAIGANPRILKSGKHGMRFYENFWNRILSGEVFRCVFTNKRRDGRLYYEDQTITPIRNSQGNITHFVSTGRDITQRKRTEEALRRLNEGLEKEAERIAQALHDEAGQFLTSAHITLAEVSRELPLSARERLQEVRNHLDQIEEQLRRLSHELRPRILDDLGLLAALEFLAEGVEKRAGIPVALVASLETRLPVLVETTLYRLAQEALTNITKHAQATRVTIQLTRESQTVRCVIRDDGIGFDAPAVLTRRGERGLGLIGILDRLEALGGTFQITSAPGQGTELRVTIPLET